MGNIVSSSLGTKLSRENQPENQELEKRRKTCLKLAKDTEISRNDQVLNGEYQKNIFENI